MREQLLVIAREAGQILLSHYAKRGGETRWKQDRSPVTEADLASHRYLDRALKQEFGLQVISEEGPPVGTMERECFLVDPLDGTRDFLDRNDEFSVCIALLRDFRPVAGVVHAPVLGVTYYAEKGGGAECLEGEVSRRLPVMQEKDLILMRSRHHDSPETARFARRNGIRRFTTVGSALKFGRLASGQATVYPRYEGSREWDTAAGHVLLTEAGGLVIDLGTGQELCYGKPAFTNGPFLACAAGVDWQRLKLADR